LFDRRQPTARLWVSALRPLAEAERTTLRKRLEKDLTASVFVHRPVRILSRRALKQLGIRRMLKHIIAAAAISVLSLSASVYAAQDTAKVQTAIPQNALTVTDWYKQDVFDPNNNKIGQVKDALVDSRVRLRP
jgi:hypothetical protein